MHVYALPQTPVHYMNLKSVSISLPFRRVEIGKLCPLDHEDVVSSKTQVVSQFASLNKLG